MVLSNHCGWILAHSSLQNCFNSASLEGFQFRLFKVMPQHLNWIQDQILTWPLQNLNLVFLEPFRGGLAGVFEIIVLLHKPCALKLEVTNWRPDILLQGFLQFHQLWQIFQVLKLQSSPRPSHYHTTTFMPNDACFMRDTQLSKS